MIRQHLPKLAALVLIASLALRPVPARADEPAPTPTLAEVIAQVEASEHKLKNLEVTSREVSEDWNQKTQQWELVNQQDSTGYFDDTSNGKIRFDVDKNVAPGSDNAAPLEISIYSVSYDGISGRELQWATTVPAEPDMPKGTITQERPGASIGRGSGREFSIYGFEDQLGRTLSAELKGYLRESRGALTATVTKGDDSFLLITLTATLPKDLVVKRLTIDPARGYALLAVEELANGRMFWHWKISKLEALADGVYYPAEVTYAMSDREGKPTTRSLFTATKLRANNPAFSDAIFTIKWPAGTHVEDAIATKEFVVAGTDEEKSKVLQEQQARAQKAMDIDIQSLEPPKIETAAQGLPPVAASVLEQHWNLVSKVGLALLVLASVAISALLGILFARKKRQARAE